jgi:hypothetical protein
MKTNESPNLSGGSSLSALRSLLSQFVAALAKMNLHGVPIEPISITLSKDQSAVKASELIFWQLGRR